MRFAALVAALGLAACVSPPSPIAKVREASQELNINARFGQNEMAMDHVAPDARDSYAARHRAWGSAVRVADVEFSGLKQRGDHDVDVFVRVAWYRLEQEELLSTTVKQGWHDAGGWQLVTEERSDGDMGLLGETVVFQAPAKAPGPAQFPTLRLGQSSTE
jgi:outer membrane murein-binding lipoprotein Lpp